MRVLLVNPPLSDVSGPFPAICYLAGFLDTIGVQADLADASLQVVEKLFSRHGLNAVRDEINIRIASGEYTPNEDVRSFLKHFEAYAGAIETALAFLRGSDDAAGLRLLRPGFLPPPTRPQALWAEWAYLRGSSHDPQLPLRFAFGPHGRSDEARYTASLLMRSVARVVRQSVDPTFRLGSYSEHLTSEASTFAPLARRLAQSPGLIDRMIDEVADDLVRAHHPDVVGLSLPFGGTVYGALRIARRIKEGSPPTRVVLGGGWVNTCLRHLSDPAVFDIADFITLDDGERPLQCILEFLSGTRPETQLRRTFVRRNGTVQMLDGAAEADVAFAATGTPTYRGLQLQRYLRYDPQLVTRRPPWRSAWNKLTLAHGCYWKKCAFCDTKLDYIGRYEPATVDVIVDRIKRLRDETGESGFHFVDEAMPPALLRRLAERLVAERLAISWWGNVRFDQALEPLAPLLAESGCVAITGGLEVASDRLLSLMQKGVSLEQVARVTHALAAAGITIHAYLIYGFPTQTAQETIDALEYVRQLFSAGCLHSGFWHRFTLTAFSPVAADPNRYGVRIKQRPHHPFADYVLEYEEASVIDHGQFGRGLKTAISRYMVGKGFDRPAHAWFDHPVPESTLSPDYVSTLLRPRLPQPPAAAASVRTLESR